MSDLQARYLGWSGFHLIKGGSSILIDPPNKISGEINGELVYCTHRHFDHTGGVSSFMENNPNAILVTNTQVAGLFKQFSDRIVIANNGETYKHGEWKFEFIESKHGFLNPVNIGVLIRNGDVSFGHLGDTVSFEGFSSAMVDTLAVPIAGVFTASPTQAIKELRIFVEPLPTIVVMHWLLNNPVSFCRMLSKEFPGTRCIVPKKGELLRL